MKKLTTLLTFIFFCIVCVTSARAQGAQTNSYRVSLTIPAIVGVNVHEETSLGVTAEKSMNMDETIERVIRSNKEILLKTSVVK